MNNGTFPFINDTRVAASTLIPSNKLCRVCGSKGSAGAISLMCRVGVCAFFPGFGLWMPCFRFAPIARVQMYFWSNGQRMNHCIFEILCKSGLHLDTSIFSRQDSTLLDYYEGKSVCELLLQTDFTCLDKTPPEVIISGNSCYCEVSDRVSCSRLPCHRGVPQPITVDA